MLVRKEFRQDLQSFGDHKTELAVLNTLNEIQHPNIVRLFCSYTHQGKHNFIFPKAQGDNLGSFLASEARPSAFELDHTIYYALASLSSGLSTLHNFTSQSLNLRMIGMHRDLKPANILVDGKTFLLADFGLSRLKACTEGSESPFTIGGGHYLAPECEDYTDGFSKNTITRSSDVWSLACVMADVATYITFGANGVKNFKESRRIKIRSFVTYTYHCGKDQPHQKVATWLDSLRGTRKEDEVYHLFISLIESMLQVKPEQRPRSYDVTVKLYLITTQSYCQHIDTIYKELLNQPLVREIGMEYRRFLSWKFVLLDSSRWLFSPNTNRYHQIKFPVIVGILREIEAQLYSIHTQCLQHLTPLLRRLREDQDRLYEALPTQQRREAQFTFELDLLQFGAADKSVDPLHRSIPAASLDIYPEIALLVAIKSLHRDFENRVEKGTPNLRISAKDIMNLVPFHDHSLAEYQIDGSSSSQRVLVEWLQYGRHWQGQASEAMFKRIEAIAVESGLWSRLQGCPIFRCSGYFHSEARLAFGLVWEIPIRSNPTQVQTLSDVIISSKDFRHRPSLGSRFRVSKALASSLLKLHSAGWLHKSISSTNVVLLITPKSRPADWLEDAFITGLGKSREDEPNAFTDGPATRTSTSKNYRHLEYTMNARRFRRDYDYFSLGLVLLEIGLWKSLAKIIESLRIQSPQDLGPVLLEHRVPLLEHSMGGNYRQAVEICLQGLEEKSMASVQNTDGMINSEAHRDLLLLKFQRSVAEPILSCEA